MPVPMGFEWCLCAESSGKSTRCTSEGCRMIGPERQQRRETRPGWGDSSAAGGCADTSSRRAGRHAREATLTRSLGAVKDRDLLAFLAEDLCRRKTLDHAHGSLATRTAPEFRI